jgi:hypothetical protein
MTKTMPRSFAETIARDLLYDAVDAHDEERLRKLLLPIGWKRLEAELCCGERLAKDVQDALITQERYLQEYLSMMKPPGE